MDTTAQVIVALFGTALFCVIFCSMIQIEEDVSEEE